MLSKLNIGKLGKDKDSTTEHNNCTNLPSSYKCVTGNGYKQKNEDCPFSASKRYPNVNAAMIIPTFEPFVREYEAQKHDHMIVPRFQLEVKELEPDSQTPKVKAADPQKQQLYPQQSHSSEEATCSNESFSREESGLTRGDCEILWEDLRLREEIGQGKA